MLSYIGYLHWIPHCYWLMSDKQNPRIFAEEVIDDDTEDDNDENNENKTKKSSFKHSHLLSTE